MLWIGMSGRSRCLVGGRVVPVDDLAGWLVVDPDGAVVEPIRRFLVDFVARGNRGGSVRSYAYVLLRWWRWLRAVGVEWDKATPAEARDLVLWLQQATKQRRAPRTVSAATAGTVNAVTRKRYLGDGYEVRTIRHNISVTWNLAGVEIISRRYDHELS